jgi:hypothetical protein
VAAARQQNERMTRPRIATPPVPASGSAPPRAAGGARPRRGRLARRHYAGLAGACGLAALLGAGCGASTGGASPTSTSPSSTSPGAATSSSASPSAGRVTPLSPATQKALAAKYLAIAKPANHSLDTENDGYGDAEHDDLATARKDLLDEAATEARFDAQLLAIRFPPSVGEQVQALVRANKVRIQLTQRQARAITLAGLRAFDSQHKAADAAVEAPVRQIRRLLGLPPPSTS